MFARSTAFIMNKKDLRKIEMITARENVLNILPSKKKTLKWFRSSKRAKRGFCRKCGESIFFKFIGSNNISIAAGMFNRPTKLKTKMNIFVKGKLDYYSVAVDFIMPRSSLLHVLSYD